MESVTDVEPVFTTEPAPLSPPSDWLKPFTSSVAPPATV